MGWIKTKNHLTLLSLRETRKSLKKSARPPSCESPLKIPRHLVQLLAIRILIPNADMKIHRAFVNSGKRSVVWQVKQCLHFTTNQYIHPLPPFQLKYNA
jgi:hypothetical protein